MPYHIPANHCSQPVLISNSQIKNLALLEHVSVVYIHAHLSISNHESARVCPSTRILCAQISHFELLLESTFCYGESLFGQDRCQLRMHSTALPPIKDKYVLGYFEQILTNNFILYRCVFQCYQMLRHFLATRFWFCSFSCADQNNVAV